MSTADDILFSPLRQANPKSAFAEHVWQTLQDPDRELVFSVGSHPSVRDYDQIAKLIDDGPHVFRKARHLVCLNNFGNSRPPGALILKEVFARLQRGEPKFWWCCKRPAMSHGIEHYHFTNTFHIAGGYPSVGISIGAFDPWVLGLLEQFLGYNEFYAFGSEQDALDYWISP